MTSHEARPVPSRRIGEVRQESPVGDPLDTLRAHATRLNSLSTPAPSARVFYEIMSGGLVWSDEAGEDLPVEVVWALRPLFAFRSSMILGSPQEKWRTYWDACVVLFPRWVGFHAERTTPTPALLRILRQGERRLDRCLESLDDEKA